ncbi:MAG: phosphate acyltransferase PlsX [Lachnospiraceae bacterium]|jgi:glycerol-3-phosphate acyltransferase PlsX
MSEKVTVALDAMGGDNAPGEIVKGAVEAVKENPELNIHLIGTEDVVKKLLDGYEYPKDRITLIPSTDVISTDENPTMAIRRKRNSSIVIGMKEVHTGEADCFVSAGNSGAVLVGGQLVVGKIRGINRPPFAPIIPTAAGPVLLLDAGANMDSKPEWLVQWAQIGSIYMKNQIGIQNPRVAIVNVGAEDDKGNALVKETFPLLQACEGINFTGSIEARDIPKGTADVIVCDAFVGNVILKMYEGTASMLLHEIKGVLMSSVKTKIGAALIAGPLKKTMKKFSAKEYGGAPLLGCRGLVVKVHGNATEAEIKHALKQCITFSREKINDKIVEGLHLNETKPQAERG